MIDPAPEAGSISVSDPMYQECMGIHFGAVELLRDVDARVCRLRGWRGCRVGFGGRWDGRRDGRPERDGA